MASRTLPFPATAGSADCDLASVAALIGDPGRAAMLVALLDRRALPAGDLARLARVGPATANEHLRKLVRGGLLAVESHGRHRYFRLAGPSVARALESLALVAPVRTAQCAQEAYRARGIRFARTCYDHLAGLPRLERGPIPPGRGARWGSGHLLELEWIERMPSSRALRVTSTGRRAFQRELDIRVL
jgi:DNA-binding transcriptional ArsR family regulator